MSLPTQGEFLRSLQTCEAPTDIQCSICTESYNDNKQPVIKIDHGRNKCYFHQDCITLWFNSNHRMRGTCPNDRTELFELSTLTRPQINLPPGFINTAAHNVYADIVAHVRIAVAAKQETEDPEQIVRNYQSSGPIRDALEADLRMLAQREVADSLGEPFSVFQELSNIIDELLMEWSGVFVTAAPHVICRVLDRTAFQLEWLTENGTVLDGIELAHYRNEIQTMREELARAFLPFAIILNLANELSNDVGDVYYEELAYSSTGRSWVHVVPERRHRCPPTALIMDQSSLPVLVEEHFEEGDDDGFSALVSPRRYQLSAAPEHLPVLDEEDTRMLEDALVDVSE
ncbi:hypothetical protein N0V90_008428 [Kalmusia sp. IMI 367209]|nr:hypothetical protein N0V90_008428 [Kalmusia sp. IMI 367209]